MTEQAKPLTAAELAEIKERDGAVWAEEGARIKRAMGPYASKHMPSMYMQGVLDRHLLLAEVARLRTLLYEAAQVIGPPSAFQRDQTGERNGAYETAVKLAEELGLQDE